MHYLIDEDGRIMAMDEDGLDWSYPEDWRVVESDELPPDGYDLADCVWDGRPVLDADGVERREAARPLDAAEVLREMFAAQPDTLASLPDDALSRMEAYMQPWETGVGYAKGDIRSHGGKPWRCLQPHTSQDGWEPGAAPSLWAEILPGQDGEIGEWVQPDSTNPYMKGDRVTHNGKVWESLVDNNVWEPGAVGTESLWHEIG